jgi:hypothetical protein
VAMQCRSQRRRRCLCAAAVWHPEKGRPDRVSVLRGGVCAPWACGAQTQRRGVRTVCQSCAEAFVRRGRVVPRPKEEASGSCVDPARRRLCARGRVSSREGSCVGAWRDGIIHCSGGASTAVFAATSRGIAAS